MSSHIGAGITRTLSVFRSAAGGLDDLGGLKTAWEQFAAKAIIPGSSILARSFRACRVSVV